MKIIDKLTADRPAFSFEFFPPKTEEGMEKLFATVSRLKRYEPAYVSVTYGAGGSTRKLTVDLVRKIKQEAGLETMAHLTCVGADREEITGVLSQLEASGVENVLALRGDPPKGQEHFEKPEGGFGNARELLEFLRRDYDFCLGAACYPEKHLEATDLSADLAYLKTKCDAGADVLVTQLFFDNEDYFRFVEQARALGITQPIIAGIMPITNLAQVKRFTKMCGASIPRSLLERLEPYGDVPEEVAAIGIGHAIKQCQDLIDRGVPGIHFYTLNKSPATVQILEAIL